MASFNFQVYLSLFALCLVSASTVPTRRHDPLRVPDDLPEGWVYKGCFSDSVTTRTLFGASQDDPQNDSIESCVAFCNDQGFLFAGLEFSSQCFCDNLIKESATLLDDTSCDDICSGSDDFCGGNLSLSIFWSGVDPNTPQTVPSVGNWVSLGCYSDNVQGRALSDVQTLTVPNTIEACTAACFDKGFQFSGTEFSGECWCGSAIKNGGAPALATDCNMLCTGNQLEFCGGPNRLNMYNYTGDDLPPLGGNVPPPPPPATPVPVTEGLPETWAYAGCFVDNAAGRVFEHLSFARGDATVESCIASCDAQGFTVAGIEFADECYCGNRLVNGAVLGDEATCSIGCAGAATEACGGANRLSVYSTTPQNITIVPVPTAQTDDLPTGWNFDGCFTDLGGNTKRVLPTQFIFPTTNSPETCINQCITAGFDAAGMEFGQECYCGKAANIAANGGKLAAPTDCSVVCSGDDIHLCGGSFRLQLYTFTPPTPPSDPTPSDPSPSDPTPSDPTSSDPAPSDPVPSDPTPSDPAPSDPIPSDPAPSDPTPSDPTPSDPVPSDSAPSDPTPSDPVPSDPVPSDPTSL